MEGVIIGLIVAGINVAVTTIIGLVINALWNKRTKEKEELANLREQQREQHENKRCETMKQAIHEENQAMEGRLGEKIERIDNDLDLMKKTMQKDVRRSLRQDGNAFVKRGYASDLEKTEFDELYWAYHNLGKNGVVDALHDQVMKLPTEPEQK